MSTTPTNQTIETKKENIRHIELYSAVFSGIMILAVFGVLIFGNQRIASPVWNSLVVWQDLHANQSTAIPMWSFMHTTRGQKCTGRCASGAQCPVRHVQNLWLQMPKKGISLKNAENTFTYKPFLEHPSYVPLHWDTDAQILEGMPVTTGATPLFSNLAWLLIIQSISVVFQTARAIPDNSITIQGPNFSRWLEYALTSPLQLYIVATQILIGDLLSLGALLAAQVGLILCGFCCELLIQRLYKLRSKSPRCVRDPKKQNKVQCKINSASWHLAMISVLAWVIHLIIWVNLLTRWDNQWSLSTRCSVNEKPPRAVFFLVWSQFVGFTAFGLIQGFQVNDAIPRANRSEHNKNSLSTEQSNSPDTQPEPIEPIAFAGVDPSSPPDHVEEIRHLVTPKNNDNKEADKVTIRLKWLQYTRLYALLSITVKVLLELSYFATAVAMPDIKSMYFIDEIEEQYWYMR